VEETQDVELDERFEELAGQEFAEMNPKRAAVEEVAKASDMKAVENETKMDAVDWFLSDDPEEIVAHRKLKLNVSTNPDQEMYIEWVVQALSRERLGQIRDEATKTATGKRRMKAGEGGDTAYANLKIATAGTMYPDLRDPKIRGQFADPADALKQRFRNKPGLIDQIAAHVIEVSGYDDEDVVEIDAVKS
jgi:hypothetical protein